MNEFFASNLFEEILTLLGSIGFFFLAFQAIRLLKK